jgi:hypothetical protein
MSLSESAIFNENSSYYASALGSGGAGVTQLIAGTGITVSPVGGTGAVTVNNAGVNQIIAGTGISLSPVGGTGAVTVNSTAVGGVSSLNALDGVVQLVASAVGVSGIVVSNNTSTKTISLSTAGVSQNPSAIACSGAISGTNLTATGQVSGATVISPVFSGLGFGNQIPSVSAGSGYTGLYTSQQGLNIVIGGIRIQGGSLTTVYNAGLGTNTIELNLTVPFVATSTPLVYTTTRGGSTVVAVQAATNSVFNFFTSGTSATEFYWLAIGSA